jgi:hypothetical protein
MAAMLEYHSCAQRWHLQGQRPSSSNMAFLRALEAMEAFTGRPCDAGKRIHAIHKEHDHVCECDGYHL